MTSHKSQDALRTCGGGSLIPFLLKSVVVQEILSPSERTLFPFFFGLSWPNQGSRYPRVWFGGTVGRKWNEIIRGHHPSRPLPDGLMVLETETQEAAAGPAPPRQEAALCSPSSSPLSPLPLSPFPGSATPSLQGEGSHIKVLFSALWFWLLCSEVWTTGSPTPLPPNPCQMHRRPEAESALLSLSPET